MKNWIVKEKIIIPPYEGRSALLKEGEELCIVDLEGKQVGDFICFNYNEPKEYISPVHMRSSLSSIRIKEGDFLYSNYRNPLMQLLKDTVGKHDFFFPACDYYRYKVDFGIENHPNCRDNLINALKRFALDVDQIPDPLSKPGDYVRLKALTDVIIAVSACSQDIVPVNGMKVTPLELRILKFY